MSVKLILHIHAKGTFKRNFQELPLFVITIILEGYQKNYTSLYFFALKLEQTFPLRIVSYSLSLTSVYPYHDHGGHNRSAF